MSRSLGAGFGLERIGLVALGRPRVAGAILMALAVLIALSLPRLEFDDDIHRVFLGDSQLSRDHQAFVASRFPRVSDVVLLISREHGFSASDLQTLRDLSLDLELFPGIAGVASPFLLRFPAHHPAHAREPVFPSEFGIPGLTDRIRAFQALGTGLSTLIADRMDALLIVVSVDLDGDDLGGALRAISDFAAGAVPAGVQVVVTGEDAISLEIVSGLKADLIRLNVLGAVLVTLGCLLLLRDARLTLLATGPGILAASAALAMPVWLGFPLTVLSNVIPTLILVLGVADGLHLVVHLKDADGDCRAARIGTTVTEVGPACALTAVTTAAAFCAILLSGNAQLREFAVLGAAGVLASFAIVLTAFVLLARAIAVPRRDISPWTRQTALWLGRIGTGAPKRVIAVSLAALILGAVGYSHTRAWFPLYQNLPKGSAVAAANDRIAEAFGGVFQLWIEMPARTGAGADDWDGLTSVVAAVEAEAGPTSTMSAVTVARWLGREDERPDAEALRPLPGFLFDRLSPDGAAVDRIAVSLPEPMRDARSIDLFDRVETAARENGAARVVGLPAIMRHEAVTLIAQLSIGLIVACGLATMIAAFAFRSAGLIPVLLIPNLLPILIAASSLHLLTHGQVAPPAVLALTIAFGIAVNDTIHYLQRYLGARERGQDPECALISATEGAGQAMILTTLVLCFGLAAAAFSVFFPVHLFAAILIVTFISALIADLTLLPALLRLKGKHS